MSIGPFNHQLCDVVLRDGSTLPLRAVRQDDIGALVTFFAGLSPESRYFRFFGVPNLDSARVAGLIPVDAAGGAALVGECGGRVVAFAGYYRAATIPIVQKWRLRSPMRCKDVASAPGCSSSWPTWRGRTSPHLRRVCAGREPQDDGRVSGVGIPRRASNRARRLPRRAVARAHARIRREGSAALATGGDGVDEALLRASNRRRGRCQP